MRINTNFAEYYGQSGKQPKPKSRKLRRTQLSGEKLSSQSNSRTSLSKHSDREQLQKVKLTNRNIAAGHQQQESMKRKLKLKKSLSSGNILDAFQLFKPVDEQIMHNEHGLPNFKSEKHIAQDSFDQKIKGFSHQNIPSGQYFGQRQAESNSRHGRINHFTRKDTSNRNSQSNSSSKSAKSPLRNILKSASKSQKASPFKRMAIQVRNHQNRQKNYPQMYPQDEKTIKPLKRLQSLNQFSELSDTYAYNSERELERGDRDQKYMYYGEESPIDRGGKKLRSPHSRSKSNKKSNKLKKLTSDPCKNRKVELRNVRSNEHLVYRKSEDRPQIHTSKVREYFDKKQREQRQRLNRPKMNQNYPYSQKNHIERMVNNSNSNQSSGLYPENYPTKNPKAFLPGFDSSNQISEYSEGVESGYSSYTKVKEAHKKNTSSEVSKSYSSLKVSQGENSLQKQSFVEKRKQHQHKKVIVVRREQPMSPGGELIDKIRDFGNTDLNQFFKNEGQDQGGQRSSHFHQRSSSVASIEEEMDQQVPRLEFQIQEISKFASDSQMESKITPKQPSDCKIVINQPPRSQLKSDSSKNFESSSNINSQSLNPSINVSAHPKKSQPVGSKQKSSIISKLKKDIELDKQKSNKKITESKILIKRRSSPEKSIGTSSPEKSETYKSSSSSANNKRAFNSSNASSDSSAYYSSQAFGQKPRDSSKESGHMLKKPKGSGFVDLSELIHSGSPTINGLSSEKNQSSKRDSASVSSSQHSLPPPPLMTDSLKDRALFESKKAAQSKEGSLSNLHEDFPVHSGKNPIQEGSSEFASHELQMRVSDPRQSQRLRFAKAVHPQGPNSPPSIPLMKEINSNLMQNPQRSSDSESASSTSQFTPSSYSTTSNNLTSYRVSSQSSSNANSSRSKKSSLPLNTIKQETENFMIEEVDESQAYISDEDSSFDHRRGGSVVEEISEKSSIREKKESIGSANMTSSAPNMSHGNGDEDDSMNSDTPSKQQYGKKSQEMPQSKGNILDKQFGYSSQSLSSSSSKGSHTQQKLPKTNRSKFLSEEGLSSPSNNNSAFSSPKKQSNSYLRDSGSAFKKKQSPILHELLSLNRVQSLNDVARLVEEHEERIWALYLYIENSKALYEGEQYELQKLQFVNFLLLKKSLIEMKKVIACLEGNGPNVFNLSEISIPSSTLEEYREREQIRQQLQNLAKECLSVHREFEEVYASMSSRYGNENFFNLNLSRDNFSHEIVKQLREQLLTLYDKWESSNLSSSVESPKQGSQRGSEIKCEKRMIQIIEVMFLVTEFSGKRVKGCSLLKENQSQIESNGYFKEYYQNNYERLIEVYEYFDQYAA